MVNPLPRGKLGWIFFVILFALAFGIFDIFALLAAGGNNSDLQGVAVGLFFAPLVLGLIALISGWGQSLFDVWPESASRINDTGDICVACNSTGRTGETFGTKSVGFICHNCIRRRFNDYKLLALFSVWGSIFVLLAAVGMFFSAPTMGQGGRQILNESLSSQNGQTVQTTTYVDVPSSGIFGPIMGYSMSVVAFLMGVALLYVAYRLLRRPFDQNAIGFNILRGLPEEKLYWWKKRNKLV